MKTLLSLLVAATTIAGPFSATEGPMADSFGPLKRKLQSGQSAVLFINGDSTSYEEDGVYYGFARQLGEAMKCKVVLHRWAEWEISKPTGPKQYDPPVVLHEGTGPTLTVYLATLPGGVAGDMFAASRRGTAIDAIPRPDCAILHQGHNMRAHARAYPEDGSAIRGLFLAAIGNTADRWPGVPQVITTQNPWKDSDKLHIVYDAIREVAALQPNVQLVDSYQLFIEAGKGPELYRDRDSVHPSDSKTNHAGADLVIRALMAAWQEAKPADKVPTEVWSEATGKNLISNGDFSKWSADAPEGWRAAEGATAEKVTEDGAPALAIRPNGKQAACLDRIVSKEEIAALAGKTISVAALVRSSPAQARALATLACRSGGKVQTFAFGDLNSGKGGWVWMVSSGIPVDADSGTVSLRFFPAFGTKPPESNDPLLVRKVIVAEGGVPFGRLAP